MLNKENYVSWSSRLLRYAKSRLNGKLIHNSIINGPYVRRMILEPGDVNREVTVTETFHVQTDDELTDKELKQIEADDQAIQTILLDLPEDIYAAEIWLRVQQMMKGSDIGIQEKKAKLVNESPHQDQSSFNQNYMQQTMPNPEDITDPTTAMNMALTLMAKAFKLNYSTPTNNNQRISLNPRNMQIAQPGMNMGQDRQMQMVGARAEGNAAGQNGNQIRCYNCRGVGHYARNCTFRPKRRDAAYLQTQLLIAQKEEAGIHLQAEEYDLMATAADLDEIKDVNANCILMANLQQASTSGTQNDKAPVYDLDGSAEEAAKFVGDFKSLANEADASLAKHKTLEFEIELLLKAVVNQDIMNIVQKESVGDKSDLQTELELTSNSVSTPQEPKVMKNDKVITPGMFKINPVKTSREEKHVPNTVRASNRTKSITVSQPPVITKKDVNSDTNGLSSTGICLWCVDSGCSKHMTGNLKLLINFIKKFMGTALFGNEHVAAILGFGQFYDSNLEIAFRRNACFVRNLEGVDLLKGDH
nr:integrase, catalytic region, zinc finger, CCHC-type, peptidase aspartic, catalytic [Tanacetum cinerariifolium]